jgi:hypothetical protein
VERVGEAHDMQPQPPGGRWLHLIRFNAPGAAIAAGPGDGAFYPPHVDSGSSVSHAQFEG